MIQKLIMLKGWDFGSINIESSMSKNPCMQILSFVGASSVELLQFYIRGPKGTQRGPRGPAWGPLVLFRSHFEWKVISNGRLLQMRVYSETKAKGYAPEVCSKITAFNIHHKDFGPRNP